MTVEAWLAFNRLPGLGARKKLDLLQSFASPDALFAAAPEAWRAAGMKDAALNVLAAGPAALLRDADRAWLDTPDTSLLTWLDPDYPALLREISDPPPLLYLRGQRQVLRHPMLAIVGSRNPTPNGSATAQAFAQHLSQTGLCIVSGLATGIDAAAHRGALAGKGPGIAVMGTGPERIYPRQHAALAAEIAAHGLLLTEYPPDTAIHPGLFPKRNRLISGLSTGVLVVEAALQSGSLVTARLAVEEGREVFAIPGSIHSPLSRGPHALIRQGAKLVERADDILEELTSLLSLTPSGPTSESEFAPSGMLPPDEARLLGHMDFDPLPFDLLVRRSGLTPDRVSAMLLTLELDGWVASCHGGRYCRLTR